MRTQAGPARILETYPSIEGEHPLARSTHTKRKDSKARQSDPREEAALMRRVEAGAEGAFDELYDRFGALVFKMAFQALPSRAEAEDAVQEVFLRLWKTAGRYDNDKAALVTWVMLITRRHIVDRLRRTKARIKAGGLNEEWAESASSDPVSTPGETEERLANLLTRLETLPDLQRTVVQRAYLGGQTLRQISQELDIPLGTVKSALSRALARLRERSSAEEAA